MTDTCRNCKFYHPYLDGPIGQPTGEGVCRRYPPIVHRESESMAGPDFGFPMVDAGEWCGEFDRKREERDDD